MEAKTANSDSTLTAHDGAGQQVSTEKQIAAVRAWAEYWGSECPDCGPQDYEFMLKHVLAKQQEGRKMFEALAALAAGREAGWGQ